MPFRLGIISHAKQYLGKNVFDEDSAIIENQYNMVMRFDYQK